MQRHEVLEQHEHHKLLLQEFNVKSLILFGSVARDEATAASDVDLLVEFNQPIGLLAFVRLKRQLEAILGCPVDLGTPNSLKPYLKENVLRECVRVF